MKKILLLALVMVSSASYAIPKPYQISHEDQNTLEMMDEEYGAQKRNGEWARCHKDRCYILRTGEVIGQGQEGIYLVFPASANGFMSAQD